MYFNVNKHKYFLIKLYVFVEIHLNRKLHDYNYRILKFGDTYIHLYDERHNVNVNVIKDAKNTVVTIDNFSYLEVLRKNYLYSCGVVFDNNGDNKVSFGELFEKILISSDRVDDYGHVETYKYECDNCIMQFGIHNDSNNIFCLVEKD